MLQRAASNAHSWRPTTRSKQSKWLDQSLQDMEQKVQYVLKLIQEDGDSFAKRAEMYYKKRPELVNFVEESNRAYRALAERYEHLSTELQYANNTLATLFPEQFQMPMDDEDDSPSSKSFQNPKSPKFGKRSVSTASKQLQARIFAKTEAENNNNNDTVSKPNLSKHEALEEIGKLQKDILALQTVKEFVKSSYQGGLSRYWDIENQIIEMQQRVSVLQDEFSLNNVVDDQEARTLMAEAALRSCQETLSQLQEKKDQHDQDAKKEYSKIEEARDKLNSIRLELLNEENNQPETKDIENSNPVEKDNEKTDEVCTSDSITDTELTEKVDELVNKVLSLENSVSTQAIMIEKLRTESDDLHAQIRALEADKANLINDTQNLRSMLEKLEEILNGIQKLNRDVEMQSNNFQSSLAEACSSLDNLSEKLTIVKNEEKEEEISSEVEGKTLEASEKLVQCDTKAESETDEMTIKEILSGKSPIRENVLHETDSQAIPTEAEKEGEFNWQQMLLTGLEDKENLLLTEYATILKKYKESEKKLVEMEKENRHYQFEVTLQIRELKCALQKRDAEIQRLLQTPNNPIKPEDLYTSNEDEEIKCIPIDQQPQVIISPSEESLRKEINTILDENLEYILRYGTSYHQIQKFEYAINDLRNQIEKLKLKGKQEGCITADMKSEIWVIHNHLREIQREETGWLEHSLVLKDELDKKFSSLCNIQDKITGLEADEMSCSSNQTAKFQGEIKNMKQENNKIREQLQMGIDRVVTLQVEISGIIRKLKEFEVSMDHLQTRYSFKQARIPLQSFILGTKTKKHKSSIFSRILSKKNRT